MKTKYIKLFLITVVPVLMVITLIKTLYAYPDNRNKNSYSPGSKTCRDCHDTYKLNQLTVGSVTMSGGPIVSNGVGTYVGGQTYSLSITVSMPGGTRIFGMGLESLYATSPYQNAGSFTAGANSVVLNVTILGQPRQHLSHEGDGNLVPPYNNIIASNSKTFNFQWTAPPTGSGMVIFHLTGLAGNNDMGSDGDYVFVKKYKVTG